MCDILRYIFEYSEMEPVMFWRVAHDVPSKLLTSVLQMQDISIRVHIRGSPSIPYRLPKFT